MAKMKKVKETNPEFDEFIEKVGDRMREVRVNLGYSNYEVFAYDKNIGRSQYGKYEKGSEDLRLSSLFKVLKAMDISFEDFFKGIE